MSCIFLIFTPEIALLTALPTAKPLYPVSTLSKGYAIILVTRWSGWRRLIALAKTDREVQGNVTFESATEIRGGWKSSTVDRVGGLDWTGMDGVVDCVVVRSSDYSQVYGMYLYGSPTGSYLVYYNHPRHTALCGPRPVSSYSSQRLLFVSVVSFAIRRSLPFWSKRATAWPLTISLLLPCTKHTLNTCPGRDKLHERQPAGGQKKNNPRIHYILQALPELYLDVAVVAVLWLSDACSGFSTSTKSILTDMYSRWGIRQTSACFYLLLELLLSPVTHKCNSR